MIDHPIRRFNEAIFVDPRIRRERADQSDVGTFRRLNGAHAAIVGMMHVPNLEGSAVAVQSAGAQGRKAALMGQLRQRIGLIHELGELGRTEKFFDSRRHRADVDEGRGRRHIHILDGHALTHHAFQPG